MPVDAADPVLHFTPNRPFTNSLGWNFHNVVHGRVNNAGFVNDQDYVRDGPPLIAVIGDSFIEAQMVPYAAVAARPARRRARRTIPCL